MGTRLFFIAFALFLSWPAAADVEIREWQVPWDNSRPRDPYVGADGLVWFVGQRDDYVASLAPDSGDFVRYELASGTGPHNLVVDEDGIVWFAGNRRAYIGRLDPATGDITRIPMPDNKARDPHTLVFDSDGDIWFTVQQGNFVGRLTTATRQVELIPVPTARARPYGIVVNSRDEPWVAAFGTSKLLRVDPDRMTLQEIDLPDADARPRRLAVTSDDNVWWVDYAEGRLGRLDPTTGQFSEWTLPGGKDSRPYGMAVDSDNRLWMVESGRSPNRFTGFDPDTEDFVASAEIPSGGGTVRHMYYHEPANEIWFGTDTNHIGRAELP